MHVIRDITADEVKQKTETHDRKTGQGNTGTQGQNRTGETRREGRTRTLYTQWVIN